MILYATYFGVIEYDGPAGLALGMSMLAAGFVIGIGGVIYDLKHKQPILETLIVFIGTIIGACFIVGFLISGFAMERWDWAAAHPEQCRLPENVRSLSCQ